MRRRIFKILLTVLALVAVACGLACASAWSAMGTRATGEQRSRVEASVHFDKAEDHFANELRATIRPDFSILGDALFGDQVRSPEGPIPFEKLAGASFVDPIAPGLRVAWLGHSTLIVELDGKRFLIDPIWGERASPVSWAGPKRFHSPPLPFTDLPKIDAVVISHDHYDHLDEGTIRKLDSRGVDFFVPLGVGAHLEYWGVPPSRIHELDWWDQVSLGDHVLVCAPSRHFSGRTGFDRNQTLWAGWAILGPTHRAYYTGDTSMSPDFWEIGDRLGPFDVTMIENGAYGQQWADAHIGPEQGVDAHQMLRGKVMIPVHWGTFNLALHTWTEPIERVRAAAKKAGVQVLTLKPGMLVDIKNPASAAPWWPTDLPTKSAEEDPVISSGLGAYKPGFGLPPTREALGLPTTEEREQKRIPERRVAH